MDTLVVDPPAATRSEQPSAADGDGGGPGGSGSSGGEPTPPAPRGRTCCNCDAPIQDGQQWCLQCGAGQPGSLGGRQSWRPLTVLALAAVLLIVAAAAAGAAALSSGKAAKPPATVAIAPAPTASVPATTTPAVPVTPTASTPAPPAPKTPSGGGTGASNPLFPSTGKPPKIPSTAPTPQSSGSSTTSGGGSGTGSGGASGKGSTEGASSPAKTEGGGSSEGQAEQPSAILLDTDAASTYNPYHYPASGFGDPALAIDGEGGTPWTAQVQPSSAPNMAVGLLLDLKTPTKLGAVKLFAVTKGMSVQLYGTTQKKPPATITEPGWTPLSATHVLKKRLTDIKLHAAPALRYLLVWVVKAPESVIGTPQAPGHIALGEVELFPPASS